MLGNDWHKAEVFSVVDRLYAANGLIAQRVKDQRATPFGGHGVR